MPPKKQTPNKEGPSASVGKRPPETKEDFEDELKLLAGQAEAENWSNWLRDQFGIYAKAGALIALMAVYANVSLLNLTPVYGQTAATRLHQRVVWSGMFIGWGGNLALRRFLPVKTILLIPLIAAYIPVLQYYLFRISSTLGVFNGPAVTESLTLVPLIALSTACVADILEAAEMSALPKSVAGSIPGIGSYGLFKYVENAALNQLAGQMGNTIWNTRLVQELVLAVTYSLMARSKILVLATPALLHSLLLNQHIMTSHAATKLNSTLSANGWSLVDRWESNTGYISVLDNHWDGYRALRCDHSLLGGEWTKFEKKVVGEPIYSVFTQLEAVRLVQTPNKPADHEASALNIGLGIGTTPSALIAHGIGTTVVEIDPVVYDFAKKYFGLPSNHTAVIEDVISWSSTNKDRLRAHYDYIIHDVFTGGAEPIDLFTQEFLETLRHMLKPNGVIAINHAGDFTLPPLSIVANTIQSVFPSCRIFRESEAPTPEKVDEQGRDFDNVIFFCTKSEDKISFRQPREADLLQSLARKAYLLPKHEVDPSVFSRGENIGILRNNETEKLAKWQDETALGHWAVMRTVLPKEIWEQW